MERASYRPNLNFGLAKKGFTEAGNRYALTVYAERNTEDRARGFYGGDAYPAVWEKRSEDGKTLYGFIIAADGVGQGSFVHPTLKEQLSGISGDRDKLIEFLQSLFGKRCLEDEEFLDYATRCFSDIPTLGYFLSVGGQQQSMPFYERDSQSLGSRIACLWIFENFRKYALEKKLVEWSEDSAQDLKRKICNSLDEELLPRVRKFFDPMKDAPNTSTRDVCFLPSTVACWFYIAAIDERPFKKERFAKVDALSFSCGDARTYRADVCEGVQQVSIDDTSDGDAMSAIVHFGLDTRRERDGIRYYDKDFRVRRLIQTTFPCALFACSDGVYDTCPEYIEGEQRIFGSSASNSTDFLFECNMQKAMRESYSLDDLERRVVFKFYGHETASDALEWHESGTYSHIKKDDSATFAMRVFATSPCGLFDGLRNKKTKLDELIQICKENDLPYEDPHIEDLTEYINDAIFAYRGSFLSATQSKLLPILKKMVEEKHVTQMWGIENLPSEAKLANGMFYQRKALIILKTAIKEWATLSHDDEKELRRQLKERSNHQEQYVISNAEIYEALTGAGFKEFYDELQSISYSDEQIEQKKKYEKFVRYFYGEDHDDRDAIALVKGRDFSDPEEAPAAQESIAQQPAAQEPAVQENVAQENVTQETPAENSSAETEKAADDEFVQSVEEKLDQMSDNGSEAAAECGDNEGPTSEGENEQ